MPVKILTIPFARDAQQGLVNTIPDDPVAGQPQLASWKEGFQSETMMPLTAGGIPPQGQDFNGLFQQITEHLVHQNSGGQYGWSQEWIDAHGGYPKGAIVFSDDGLACYYSAVDNNAQNFNTNPASIGVEWLLFASVDSASNAREWIAATVSRIDAETGVSTVRKAWTAQRVRQTADAAITARVVNTVGQSEDEVMSQKATTDAIAAVAVAGSSFNKPLARRGKPLFVKTSPAEFIIPEGFSAAIDGITFIVRTDVTLSLDDDLDTGTKTAGSDYFVHITENGSPFISLQETVADAALIGGFHYGLTTEDEAPSGNKTEWDMEQIRGINAYTFWDLNFRCTAKAGNRGRFFYKGGWYDIYLAGEDYGLDFYSKPFVFIAAGASYYSRKYPKIPLEFGGDGVTTYGKLTPFQAMDLSNAAGMSLIEYDEFTAIAYGVQEGLAQAEPVVGMVGHQPALTSKYGMEQAAGVQWIWGRTKGSSSYSSGGWKDITDGRGQVYSGLMVGLLGAVQTQVAERSGSRASFWDSDLTHSLWSDALRCRGDHLQRD